MKRTNKKGFTIVELVIVIAVIAILAAVLIPNISRLVRKAQVSNDLSLVRNLNLALETESATMDYPTAYDAFAAVKENGYDIAKIEAKASNNKILYDEVNKCFVYLNGVNLEYYPNSKKGDTATQNHQLWTVVTSAEDAKKSQYSVYWNGGDNTAVEVKDVGFDVGVNKNVNVTVTAATQELTVRTNGGNMKITSDGTINHYGMIEKADLQKVASKSYHEFGYVTSYIKVTSGRIVVEPKASVSIIAVANASVTIEQKAGSELFKVAPTTGVTLKKDNIKVLSEKTVVETALENLDTLRYGGGDGSAEHPYELYTAAHLVAFAKDINEGKQLTKDGFVNAKLCADVDISGMGWEPIGNVEHPFYGSFNGMNNTIKGLTNKGYAPSQVLFGSTANAKNFGTSYGFFGVVGSKTETSNATKIELRNVNFSGVAIDTDSANMLGVLLGADVVAAKDNKGTVNKDFAGNVTIENITVAGTIKSTRGSTIGGVVGKLYTKGGIKVANCINNCDFDLSNTDISDIKVGGIIGFLKSDKTDLTIEKCESNGTITARGAGDGGKNGNIYVGGILSFFNTNYTNQNSKAFNIKECKVTTHITIESTNNLVYAGLVYGGTDSQSKITISGDTTKASCTVNGISITAEKCQTATDTTIAK